MKRTIFSIAMILSTMFCKGQTGYFFAYGVNTGEKKIYISYIEDVSKYTECEEAYGYRSKIDPKECLLDSFRTSLKIEVGRTHYRYELTPITKRNSNGYGTDEYFASKDDAERKRKEIMAEFSERDYRVVKLNL